MSLNFHLYHQTNVIEKKFPATTTVLSSLLMAEGVFSPVFNVKKKLLIH
jgi:hypothetical protein